MTILDTNVFSEVLRPSPDERVLRWLASQEPLATFVTAITLAEMLYGVEALPAGKRRARLVAAVNKIFAEEFQERILPFGEDAARVYPKVVAGWESVGRPISQADAMIAAVARVHGATLATRNTTDFEHCGIRIIDPWTG